MSVSPSQSTDVAVLQKSLPLKAPVRAYAALAAGQVLQPWGYEAGPLGSDEVELAVTHCGLCHGTCI